MPVIAVNLLGPPDVRIDDAPPPAPLRWRKHFGLCLLLWNSSSRRISRDTALAMLWGDRGEREARHSLNEALRVIRKSVGTGTLDTSGDAVQWIAPMELDLETFAAREHDDPVAAARLVTGDWCEGFTVPDAADFERWLDDERRRWRHRLVKVLAVASGVASDIGDLRESRVCADRARRLDPLNEFAAQASIRVHALTGDRSAAMGEAESFTQRLEKELGVPASVDTIQLLRRVAGIRSRRPVATEPAPRREVPFTGRSQAMASLLACLRTAGRKRSGALMLVDGESGAGRTRLLEEVCMRAALDGFTAFTLRAVPSDAAHAGAGLHALAASGLSEAQGVAGIPSEALGSLIAASPGWAERFRSPGVATPMPLEDALIAVLRAAASERPVLLAIDDLDNFDSHTLGTLPHLLRGVAVLPVVLLGTMCVGDTRAELDALRRLARAERGVLTRVEALDAQELLGAVREVLPGWDRDAQDRLTRRIMAESAGLPAIAVGVLEAVVQGLSLGELGTTWPARDRTLDATLPGQIPDALTAAIRMRFHQLGPTERHLLTLVAVGSAAIGAERLGRLLQLDRGTVDQHLDALEWERWLVADARGYRYRARAVGTLVAAELVTSGQRLRLQEQLAAN
jgi:DNA-binding SARP family transcriptional activator